MTPIRSVPPTGLEWGQPSVFSNRFELKSGDSLVAALEFKKLFGTLAEANTAGGSWTFKRGGFLSPVVTARVAGTEADIASYTPNWSHRKGQISLATGETLELRATNFWGSEWALAGVMNESLLVIRNKGILHHGAEIELSEPARARDDIGMLLALVWYILVLHMRDSAAVAGAGA